MEITKAQAEQFLLQMYQIRAFEEQAEKSYMAGKIHGTMHLSIGQEASAVGSVSALNPDDYILSTHRGHGHCIAKGADLQLMMAEFYGKANGYCRGRGGSMHIADVASGNLGANGVVGGGIPMAVGVGLGLKMKNEGKILLSFFGDGAASAGAFHESMELSVINQVPVVFVCENNQYAMSFPSRKWTTSERLASFAEIYGMPGKSVDGNDLLAVREAAEEAVAYTRAGNGPALIVCDTYRWRGHSKSDRNRYRTQEEIEDWKQKDPIERFIKTMTKEKVFTSKEAEQVKEKAYQTIEDARLFAEASPDPDVSTLEEGVYAPW
ncbi:MAG TPA: thiamine pyrophosphate-dependent dehydrogenase E1 component subunit alpha [Anaerolineales bacterium]|nr:thiamine pyrophosphate-dependent dehydrogenase E1 component subunit alpha [Anaerolineales bacterium]